MTNKPMTKAQQDVRKAGLAFATLGLVLIVLSFIGIFGIGVGLVLLGAFVAWLSRYDQDNPPKWIIWVDAKLEKLQ